ncbi:glycosyltransferase [Pseudarthrobacter phenanthrenivorans]|uniref:Glycosyltransferase n=2 Tax=Pseudarthrobacter phenanthrenivorans TaxID=361575 RepID=A0A3B0FXH0_PSEPS|nr:glycosyltransferase family 4 protein [Pseudarthrobacter phenanthrenivorans]ADX71910.1 glycosyltransferase [Pseudarthrobacter phenanthrenivorans Sphe3]RKO24489.1 glycosyltransferase [Pseudarthrobacter phenanthrenivorans]
MQRIRLLVPGNIQHHSGGNVYNARLVRGLKANGIEVEVVQVDGSWPYASAHARRRLGTLLGAWEPHAEVQNEAQSAARNSIRSAARNDVALVDGLIAMGAPDELEFAAKAGRETWVLVHMPAPARHELEARSLRAATGVICTSTWASKVLEGRHRLHGLAVALPGTDPAPLAKGSVPPHFLVVAALLPNKDQLLTISALARLQDLDWTASFVGSDEADEGYATKVRAAVQDLGLGHRIRLEGELTGEPLERAWGRADLSLLVSRAEAFGMVVTESLARGIPVVVRAGTGAVEALRLGAPAEQGAPGEQVAPGERGPLAEQAARKESDDDGGLPGAAVAFPADDDPENPAVLAGVLRQWLEDAGLRAAWQARAREARGRLPGWDRTAAKVLEAMSAGPST